MKELSVSMSDESCWSLSRGATEKTALHDRPAVGPPDWIEQGPGPIPVSEPEEDDLEPVFTFHLSKILALGLEESLAWIPLEPSKPLPLETFLEWAKGFEPELLATMGDLERILPLCWASTWLTQPSQGLAYFQNQLGSGLNRFAHTRRHPFSCEPTSLLWWIKNCIQISPVIPQADSTSGSGILWTPRRKPRHNLSSLGMSLRSCQKWISKFNPRR